MSKDQLMNNQLDLNTLFQSNGATNKTTVESEEGHLYPRLPSYSEAVPSTQASYTQYQHTHDSYMPYRDANVQNTELPPSSRFGLIRGYHQQMYEPTPQAIQCCDCSGLQSKHGINDSKCNWGIICGTLLLILGVLALTMGFTLPQKIYSFNEKQKLSRDELQDIETINFYVEIFILSGLTILSVGGIVISMGILYPLCRRDKNGYDELLSNKYYDSEVYVKEVEPSNKAGNPTAMVNFGFHKDIVPSDITLRRIQPERRLGLTTTGHEITPSK